MKNYDEIAENVLARSQAILKKQKMQRKAALRWGSLAACLVLIVSLSFGFFETTPVVDSTETTAAPTEPEKEIILPPTRYGASSSESLMARSYTPAEAYAAAEAVAWIRVGNWLGENLGKWVLGDTYFEVEVIECYKGDLPDTFVLRQTGCSAATMESFPLLTYGNELLVFLKQSTIDTIHDGCYYIFGEYSTLMDVYMDDGVAYASDRFGCMTQELGDDLNNVAGNKQLKSVLSAAVAEYDSIQSSIMANTDYLYTLADIIENMTQSIDGIGGHNEKN